MHLFALRQIIFFCLFLFPECRKHETVKHTKTNTNSFRAYGPTIKEDQSLNISTNFQHKLRPTEISYQSAHLAFLCPSPRTHHFTMYCLFL